MTVVRFERRIEHPIEADAADKLFHTVLGLASLGAGLASPRERPSVAPV